MALTKINGNTYYLPATTNIGLFAFKDKYCLLIDSGNHNQQARKIAEVVETNYNIKYIVNTHNHIDHSGGNVFFKEHYPGTILHASKDAKLYIETDNLFPMYLYGGNPIKDLAKHFVTNKNYIIDVTLEPGIQKINNEKFDIIPLPGHATGQIGIGTRDRVCFLGDALFSDKIINKYSLPFLFDIQAQLNTYQTITELDYDYFVLSHADQVYNADDIKKLVKFNQDNLTKYLDMVLEIIIQPKTKEDLLEEIIILNDLAINFKEYHFSLSTISSMITYLAELDQIDYQIENGKLYYYKK
jgi:glyoxylase-like metal-dependent hydrolase (beta-lactamase superfamily II)